MRHPNIKHPSTQHRKTEAKQTYYWIVGVSDASGRGMIFGYKTNMAEAEKAVEQIHNAHCEIVPSHTNNEDEFSRELRGKALMETGDIDVAYRKFDHTNRV
ncbi:hypothetical protein M0R04_08150 [Candidatus Dojkabacteria bacterium]|jgi:hypothetical protein|nr:hypothetical protein [Candidatus Dojkabacteria bacterium]